MASVSLMVPLSLLGVEWAYRRVGEVGEALPKVVQGVQGAVAAPYRHWKKVSPQRLRRNPLGGLVAAAADQEQKWEKDWRRVMIQCRNQEVLVGPEVEEVEAEVWDQLATYQTSIQLLVLLTQRYAP